MKTINPAPFILVVFLISFSSISFGNMIIADFENYTEGFCSSGFTDNASGIHFSEFYDIDSAACIEYVGYDADRTVFSDTNYLTGSGYAPGPGASLAKDFGFKAELNFIADAVSVDVFLVAFEPGTLTLKGYSQIGELLESKTLHFTMELWSEENIFIQTSTPQIASIELIADNLYTGYDNITAVPEPATICLLGLCGLLIRKRRKK